HRFLHSRTGEVENVGMGRHRRRGRTMSAPVATESSVMDEASRERDGGVGPDGSPRSAQLEGEIADWLRDVCGQMSEKARTKLVAEIMRVEGDYAGDAEESSRSSWKTPRIWWLRGLS